MPKKIKPTGKQQSMFLLHVAAFAVVTFISWWVVYHPHPVRWAYPWPAWTTAAWSLLLLGHYCVVYKSYEDKGYGVYRNQQGYES